MITRLSFLGSTMHQQKSTLTTTGARYNTWLGLLALIIFALPSISQSQIHILDCNGTTRAYKAGPTAANTEVIIKVSDKAQNPATGVKVKLVNKAGETLVATSSEGSAIFNSVPAGTWVIDPEQGSYYFSEISIYDPSPLWLSNGPLLGFIGGGAVGIAALGGAFDGNSGRDGNSAAPPTPEPTPFCPTCNPDEEAPSVQPFALNKSKIIKMDLAKADRRIDLKLRGPATQKIMPNSNPRTIQEQRLQGTRNSTSNLTYSSRRENRTAAKSKIIR